MTLEEALRQLLGLDKAWRVVEDRLEASASTFLLRVEETPDLWPEENTRAGAAVACHDHVELLRWRRLNVFNSAASRVPCREDAVAMTARYIV